VDRVGGNYQVLVTNNFGCNSISQTITTTLLNDVSSIQIRASRLQLCEGDSALLQIDSVTNTRYQWLKNGLPIPLATGTQIWVSETAFYACEIIYQNTCQRLIPGARLEVMQRPLPPSMPDTAQSCLYGDFSLSAPTYNNAIYSWTGPNNYFSSSQSLSLTSLNRDQAGVYYLTVEIAGCVRFEDSILLVIADPLPEIKITGHRTYCPGQTIKLNPDSLVGANYRWVLPNGDTIPQRMLRLEAAQESGAEKYSLIVSRGNCTTVYEEIVRVKNSELLWPTAFSPNGDGLNEQFGPTGENDGPFSLDIYDRWGKLVFHSERLEDWWDGNVFGQACEIGSYSYVYNYRDCNFRQATGKGTFKLIR
jgi:gliding motility-associated-like protein